MTHTLHSPTGHLIEHTCPTGHLITYKPHVLQDIHTQTFPIEEVLHDGHERSHLTEDETAMISGLELGQHPIQHLKLARGSIQLRSRT